MYPMKFIRIPCRWAKIETLAHAHTANPLSRRTPLVKPTSLHPFQQKRCISASCIHKSKDKDSGPISHETGEVDTLRTKSIQDLIKDAKSEETPEPPEFPSDIKKARNDRRRDQTRGSYRPRVDPTTTSVMLFPGQGSQFVGMGRKALPVPKVQEIYHIANKILGYDLLDLCLNGPKEELDKTVHCQPAVFVTSLAAVEKLKDESEEAILSCITAAGFSVGEFAALVFAGAMTFEDALYVVNERAKAMQSASEDIPGGMMSAFLGAENKAKMASHVAGQHCIRELHMPPETVDCVIANYLFPECKVYAGNVEALDFIQKHSKDFGIRRTKHLAVSGAFHSQLMSPALPTVKKALSEVTISRPVINVHSNVDALPYGHPREIAQLLAKQVVRPVLWEQTLHKIYQRKKDMPFPRTYEVGPGNQLGVMLKMTNGKAYEEYRSVDV